MLTTSTAKILYIDDDSDDCFFLSESLSDSGMLLELQCATDGEDAIQQLNRMNDDELPGLIILDMNMPKWDGRQTLRYLKETKRYAQIPVIILSTSENRVDQEICRQLGAVSYLKKPFHFDGYKQIIHKFLPFLPHAV